MCLLRIMLERKASDITEQKAYREKRPGLAF